MAHGCPSHPSITRILYFRSLISLRIHVDHTYYFDVFLECNVIPSVRAQMSPLLPQHTSLILSAARPCFPIIESLRTRWSAGNAVGPTASATCLAQPVIHVYVYMLTITFMSLVSWTWSARLPSYRALITAVTLIYIWLSQDRPEQEGSIHDGYLDFL